LTIGYLTVRDLPFAVAATPTFLWGAAAARSFRLDSEEFRGCWLLVPMKVVRGRGKIQSLFSKDMGARA
jgi:hypothetical protein